MTKKIRLSVIIIARNEEKMIEDCLKSVSWADEVLLIDTGSKDDTVKIAKQHGAKIAAELKFKGHRFSDWRKIGMKKAKGEWLFYLDADERVTPLLKQEILTITSPVKTASLKKKAEKSGHADLVTAFAIPRRNFYFGKEMHFGGAWPDYVKRLFWKQALLDWRGRLHEEPEFEGKLGKLENPMIHQTHRDLTSMLEKTINWTKIEAKLLYDSGHPPVTWWRVFRMMLTKFWERVIKQQAWRDGVEGWINAIFEVFNTFIIYARVWEMQRKGFSDKE